MPKKSSLRIGDTFSYLTLEALLPNRRCICSCRCGRRVEIHRNTLYGSLRSKRPSSCGCYHSQRISSMNTIHGLSYTAAHASWVSMLNRCKNPKDKRWKEYGGRGIKVCDRWESCNNFYEDMGERPKGYSLERINVDLGYSPDNCKWIPMNEQSKNRTNTIRVGELCLKEYCRLNNLSYERCHQIYRKTGDLELALLSGGKRE